jgi:hypothetical protein
MPDVALAAAGLDDVADVDPCLADELGLLVVVEDGDFELVVVGRVADGEAQFFVPAVTLSAFIFLSCFGMLRLTTWAPVHLACPSWSSSLP